MHPTDQCMYTSVYESGGERFTYFTIEEGALPLSWGHSWKKGIWCLIIWLEYTDFGLNEQVKGGGGSTDLVVHPLN